MFAAFGASGDADLTGMLSSSNDSAIVQNINQVGNNINSAYNNAVNGINQRGIDNLKQLNPALETLNSNIASLNAGALDQLQGKMSSINAVAQQAASNTQLISDFANRASSNMPMNVSAVTADITSEQNVTNNILSDYSNNSQALLSRLLEAGIQQINGLNLIARILDAKSFDVNVNPQINVAGSDGFEDASSNTQQGAKEQ